MHFSVIRKMYLRCLSSIVVTLKRFSTGCSSMVHRGAGVVVVCGPSGSGKSTLLRRLFEEFPDKFGFSVSHTTRQPRPGEEDGKHYHFITKETMQDAISKGEFLECAVFSNNMYGTSKASVDRVSRSGKVCVLDIEVQGVQQVKETDLKPVYIFVKPPSLVVLEKRLRDRGTETEDSLKRRLETAKIELEYGCTAGNFDLVLVNDSLEKAYEQLRTFIANAFDKQEARYICGNVLPLLTDSCAEGISNITNIDQTVC